MPIVKLLNNNKVVTMQTNTLNIPDKVYEYVKIYQQNIDEIGKKKELLETKRDGNKQNIVSSALVQSCCFHAHRFNYITLHLTSKRY